MSLGPVQLEMLGYPPNEVKRVWREPNWRVGKYGVERHGLRYRIFWQCEDDGIIRPCSSVRFWSLISALRIAQEINSAESRGRWAGGGESCAIPGDGGSVVIGKWRYHMQGDRLVALDKVVP